MKKLLSAFLLGSSFFAPVQAQQTPKTFSGECVIRDLSYITTTEVPCVVSTNSQGIYDNRDRSERSWVVSIKGSQKTVVCKEDGTGILIKPMMVTSDYTSPEFKWYGTCKGNRMMGISYITLKTELTTLSFPQW